jgi:hypothetical protein
MRNSSVCVCAARTGEASLSVQVRWGGTENQNKACRGSNFANSVYHDSYGPLWYLDRQVTFMRRV